MPPKADSGSAATARDSASEVVDPRATPDGLLCLITTAAGVLNMRTDSSPAEISVKLT